MVSYQISRMNALKQLEYCDIPDRTGNNVAQNPLYSAEYSRLQSCQLPLIFQKKF